MLPQRAPSGYLRSQQDEMEVASRGLHNDGGNTVAGNPNGGDGTQFQKFSLKFEELTANSQTRSAEGLCSLFRRSRPQIQQPQAPLQKSYSQYNLTQLSNVVVDESWRKKLDGTYGLLARRIEVPPNVWENLQLREKLHEQSMDNSIQPLAENWVPWRRSIFGLPLMHPYSPLAVGWRCAMLLFDLSFTAFWVPLNVGFCFTHYGDLGRRCTRSDLAGAEDPTRCQRW
ncbi:hypothetical protein Vretifemale_6917 [Volvox reticuliferus]|uniref:Uncharacterized protein n=1 Tax=Volvox reticuliferus TaxID=1737510 RepID=A0A8J4C9S1_9CHLO|nr:hypothetical protein Vretifemale_6917 [Volvox reticuliferus]